MHPQLNSRALLPQTERTLLSGSCRLHTRGRHTAASLATTQATSTSDQHKSLCKCEQTCLALRYYLQILPVETLLRARMKPAKSAPSPDSPVILLSDARQSKTYSVARDTSRSPVVLHGWPHSRNVPTYDAHTRIYNRERVLRKNSPT